MTTPEDQLQFVTEYITGREGQSELLNPLTYPRHILHKSKLDDDVYKIGVDVIKSGKVAIVMAAGGLSTRMGAEIHRGNMVIGPVSNRTIFRLQGEKIEAIRQRYASNITWIVMTSPQVHDEVVQSFEQEEYFGNPKEFVWFITQPTLPILSPTDTPVISANGQLLVSPTGHGAFYDVIYETGVLSKLIDLNVKYFFFFQYPNVLENICDPSMLGFHIRNHNEVTVKCIESCSQNEKMGHCVGIGDSIQIVEYHYISKTSSAETSLYNFPANIGSYIIDTELIRKCKILQIDLPYNVVPHHMKASSENYKKLERFIFDIFPFASRAGVIIVPREDEYAPVKSQSGPESVDVAKKALADLYRRWLVTSGVEVFKEDISIEISPFFALSQRDIPLHLPLNIDLKDGVILV